MNSQKVSERYDGASVFITGGTGFLGKILLEKLLYSCPGIEKVYLLIREKKNDSIHQRIKKMTELPMFSRIREKIPLALDKIVPIAGDISEPRLGVKAEDEKLLIDKVSFVFHVAASIRFDDPLDTAMNLNVGGTARALNLSRLMKNIKVFVYVSTAYSNTDKPVIEEIVYPAPASLSEVKKLMEIGISEEQIKELTKDRPNTYTFSKALAESLVAENHGHVPSVIIRPSVVSSCKSEPLEGWVDHWFGATGHVFAIGKGASRVILAQGSNRMDLIPADYVTNCIIVAASKCNSSNEVKVYNCATSGENPLCIDNLTNLIIKDSVRHGFSDLPMPMVFVTKLKWLVLVLTLLLQTIPAYIVDICLVLTGRKPRLVKFQAKIIAARDSTEYFTLNDWKICAHRTRELAASLSEQDKIEFPCDPVDINWEEYIPSYCCGIRRYLWKS